MSTENSEMNEPHKFISNLLQRLDSRSSHKDVVLHYLLTYLLITCGKI